VGTCARDLNARVEGWAAGLTRTSATSPARSRPAAACGPRTRTTSRRACGSSACSRSRGALRVLALLPSELTRLEIAAELGVSLDTVKSHTRRLYRRLGAQSREEAVELARERGLI